MSNKKEDKLSKRQEKTRYGIATILACMFCYGLYNYLGIDNELILLGFMAFAVFILTFIIMGYLMNARNIIKGIIKPTPIVSFFKEYAKGIKMAYEAFNDAFTKE